MELQRERQETSPFPEVSMRVWEIHMGSDVFEENGKTVLVETVCVKSFQSRQEKLRKSKARVNQCLGNRRFRKHRKKNKVLERKKILNSFQ